MTEQVMQKANRHHMKSKGNVTVSDAACWESHPVVLNLALQSLDHIDALRPMLVAMARGMQQTHKHSQ